jgi:hypothetical protein
MNYSWEAKGRFETRVEDGMDKKQDVWYFKIIMQGIYGDYGTSLI